MQTKLKHRKRKWESLYKGKKANDAFLKSKGVYIWKTAKIFWKTKKMFGGV